MKGRHRNHRRASEHWRWKRGRLKSSHGYAKLRVGVGHPLADPLGYAYEHLVVWIAAGKPRPRRGECLIFRNGERSDCRISNLKLVSKAEHNRLKNAAQLRGPDGRMLSKLAARIVRAGGSVRVVRAAP